MERCLLVYWVMTPSLSWSMFHGFIKFKRKKDKSVWTMEEESCNILVADGVLAFAVNEN